MWGRGGPRDLALLNRGVQLIPNVQKIFKNYDIPSSLQATLDHLGDYETLTATLDRTLKDDLPHLTRDGGFIRPVYHAELDALLNLKNNSQGPLEELYVLKKLLKP